MICDIPLQSPLNHHLETRLHTRKDGPHILCPLREHDPFIPNPKTFRSTTHTSHIKMVQAFTITHTTNQQQRPRSNAILNDNNNNDKMNYDPTRKATEREELPVEKIDVGQVSPLHLEDLDEG
jgi:hypothetical protein